MSLDASLQREPAETLFADELQKVRERDHHPVPPGWNMSPVAVETFVVGNKEQGITRKFVAESGVVRRVVISLCTNRGCLLLGEPGTAKSWLSELIAAAVSGDSRLTIQGGAISRIEQLLYDWNRPVLEAQGPVPEALVPGPLYRAMQEGKLVRFEEISRCPQQLQDAILSILSDRVIVIPELDPALGVIYAHEGFNMIATSNSVDEGVNRMSAALKRRMNFETIRPIRQLQDEITVVFNETCALNKRSGIDLQPDAQVLEMLVTLFHELRSGQSLDGRSTHRLANAALSTAEAVNVAHALSVHAWYYADGVMTVEDMLHFIIGTALKDDMDDRRRLKRYFETEVAEKQGSHWQALYAQRRLL